MAADAVLFKDSRVWLGGYDLSGTLNNIDLKASKAELKNDRFGDVAECFEQGIESVKPMLKGFMDYTATGVDAILYPRIKTDTTTWPLTICPPYAPAATPGADGNICYTIVGKQFALETGAAHGELLPYSLTSNIASTANAAALYRQTIALPKTTYASTTSGTAIQLGVLAATQKIVATFQVFAITGGSWVVTIESDDNSGFSSATTRGTFTAITTAANRQVVEVNGAVATDNYWRLTLTKTGGTSIQAAGTLSIERLL